MTDDVDKIIAECQDHLETPPDPNYDYTPVFHGGILIGCGQDLRDGVIDPSDPSYKM